MSSRIAIGALAGLVIVLLLTLVMPSRYVATAHVRMRPGSSFSVPSDAGYIPRAQLYGAVGPRQQPAMLTFTATAATGGQALRRVSIRVRHFARNAPVQSGAITIERSPRMLRDVALGVIAGALLALAVTTITRPLPPTRWPEYSSS